MSLNIRNNNSASTIQFTLTPLDTRYNDYGGKTVVFSIAAASSATITFDQPNVSGVRITGGSFSIQSASGITMNAYLNDPAWELIQVVGLPFKKGSIDPALYQYQEQGFVNTLTEPEIAFSQRVLVYQLFYKNSPATATDGTAIPIWKIPTDIELLNAYNKLTAYRNTNSGLLNDIKEMFVKVYQTSAAFYLGMQKNFLKEIVTLGIVDPANTRPKQNGTYRNPVCSSVLLSACSDCWNALGLGFGTTDFLPVGNSSPTRAASRGDLFAFDYMVTATFKEPLIDTFLEFPVTIRQKLTGFEEVEYAALAHFDIQLPPAPVALLAENVSENRPLARDDNYYNNVRISWVKPDIEDRSPLTYAIAFQNNLSGGGISFLNPDRPFISGKSQPYTPAMRADAEAEDLPGREGEGFERFYHDRSPVPFIGSIDHKYFVASQNVFGLWSNWSFVQDMLTAKPPQIPSIVSAAFTLNTNAITNHIYKNSTLEIVINYDWEDRSPFEIQLAGYYLTVPTTTPPVTVPGIVRSSSGGTIDKYVIRFTGGTPKLGKLDASNNFVAVPAKEGVVAVDATASSGSSNGGSTSSGTSMRTYQVTLKLMLLNFTSQSRLWYTLYIRASEFKNPGLFSIYSNLHPATFMVDAARSTVINVSDPIARNAPSFSPAINWASLPDATNTSRFHLTFTGVPGAAGYAVYRATEMSLRDRMTGTTPFPANGSLFQRRDWLLAGTAADKISAIDAFIRVNKKMLVTTDLELEMNGDTGGLFIYAVSSFTDQNVESVLSDWIFVAVPEKITPAPPKISGFVNKKLPVPKVILKVDLGAGNNTSKVEIFRTSKKYLGADVNLMGLPVNVGPAASWSKYKTIDGVNDQLIVDPTANFDYYKLEENAAAGWAPLYYRAIGLGLNQPSNGKLPGRSPSSNLLEILPPTPADPPQIADASLIANAALTKLRLVFKTNAFVGKSPYGMHTLFIYKQNANGLWDEVQGGNIPELNKLKPGETEPNNELVRLPTITSGFSTYAYNFGIATKISLKVVVADPFGRKSEVIVSYKKPTSKVTISNIVVKVLSSSVNVSFKTNVSKTPPTSGQYTLALQLRSKTTRKTILLIAMHNIPDKLSPFSNASIAGGTTQDSRGLYSYTAVFRGQANMNDFAAALALIVQITDPKNTVTEAEKAL